MITNALNRLAETSATRNPRATLQDLKKDLQICKKSFQLMTKKEVSNSLTEKKAIQDEVFKLRSQSKTQYSQEQLETKIKNFNK
jgi:hypothetical protein